jgi:hypothetical protein
MITFVQALSFCGGISTLEKCFIVQTDEVVKIIIIGLFQYSRVIVINLAQTNLKQ